MKFLKKSNRLKLQRVCIWIYTLSVAAGKCSYVLIKQLTFTGIKIFYRCQIYKNDLIAAVTRYLIKYFCQWIEEMTENIYSAYYVEKLDFLWHFPSLFIRAQILFIYLFYFTILYWFVIFFFAIYWLESTMGVQCHRVMCIFS